MITGRDVWRAGGAALLVAACSALTACPARDDRDAAPPTGEPDDPSVAVCLRGSPFVATGTLDVRAATPADAERVAALRWQRHEGCERLVIDLAAAEDDAAQRAGRVRAEVLRELGLIRIELRDVPWVDPEATDAELDGPLARAAFAVSSPEGRWVHVDVHLGEPAETFVTTLDEPARVVVDLRPGGGAVPGPPPRHGHVVVLEPRPGRAAYPLRVRGYARTFEANVVVRLVQNGADVFEDFTTATAWVDAWGAYEIMIPRGPRGQVTLHVGDYSARDGTWAGAVVELDMR